MQRTQIYLTEQQIERLDAEAEKRGVTRSDVIREAVDKELARPKSLYEAVMAGKGLKGAHWSDAAVAKRRREMAESFERSFERTRRDLAAGRGRKKR